MNTDDLNPHSDLPHSLPVVVDNPYSDLTLESHRIDLTTRQLGDWRDFPSDYEEPDTHTLPFSGM